jgi:hypothetical protein
VTVAQKNPVNVNRNERIIAYMLASAIGASILSIIAIIAATGLGVRNFGEGVWPVVIMLPYVGLPIGFLLVITLLVLSGIRKSRAARDDRN